MNNLKISIIIIGHNTRKPLKSLLESINKLNMSVHVFEVIYVDDGSSDFSYDFFNSYNLKFNKKSTRFSCNRGRVAATQKAIELSRGSWFLFVQSNVILSSSLLVEYAHVINSFNAKAYMGRVKYGSRDKIFNKYLNNNNRGVSKYFAGDLIHYKYLLFSNSMVRGSVFKSIQLNKKMRSYGGEELDFAFRLNARFPNMIKASPLSVVVRNNHPSLSKHCLRLFEFGKNNFFLLTDEMRLAIVPSWCLLKFTFFFKPLIYILYLVCSLLNKYNFGFLNFYIIRLQLLSSLLRGYYSGS